MTGDVVKKLTISVGNKKIGPNVPVFTIAEAGCNFEGDIRRAKEMIKAAASTGADAIKFQTFIPEKLVTKDAPKFWEIPGCVGKTQYEEFEEIPQLSFEEYKELKKTADANEIIFFSTPSDEKSADMLQRLEVPIYKIGSMDITHFPLLKHIARKKKPMIISTGASTIDEVKEAVRVIETQSNHQIALLHCITNYPTRVDNVNLNMMKNLMSEFPQYPVGYSDHTKMPESEDILIAAVALGAKVIEKHFTFDKNRPGYDHEISADYSDLRKIIKSIRTVEKAMGAKTKRPIPSEKKARILARRSLVSARDIPKGITITKEMIAVKRPGTGIEPKFLGKVIGKKAKRNIKEDEVITWEMVC